MGMCIVVTSGKGGTGKTTASGTIGSCLAALGHKTLCIDCDIGLRNLDMVLGLADLATMDFNDVLNGGISLEDAAIEHPQIKNLFFLGAPANISPEDICPESMAKLIKIAKEAYDYCIIDCPAGIGTGFKLAVENADMAIVVATSDGVTLRCCQRAVSELKALGIENIRLLMNKIKPRRFKRKCTTIDDAIDTVGAQLIGIISEDEAVVMSAVSEIPLALYDSKRAAEQFLRVAYRIKGIHLPLGKV
jgi:septum site-determining protein MinD